MSSSMRNKLQGIVALFCSGQVGRDGKMNKKEQKQMLSKFFHGDKKTQMISHAAMLADWEGVFLDAFEDVSGKPG